MTFVQYKELFDALQSHIKTVFLEPLAGASEILDRIITQRSFDNTGRGAEQFYKDLRRGRSGVDVWMFNTLGLSGLGDSEQPSITTIDKPITVLIQYYTDFRVGTGASNTEKDFDEKLIHLDYLIERNRRTQPLPNYRWIIKGYSIEKQRPIIHDATLHRIHCLITSYLQNVDVGID